MPQPRRGNETGRPVPSWPGRPKPLRAVPAPGQHGPGHQGRPASERRKRVPLRASSLTPAPGFPARGAGRALTSPEPCIVTTPRVPGTSAGREAGVGCRWWTGSGPVYPAAAERVIVNRPSVWWPRSTGGAPEAGCSLRGRRRVAHGPRVHPGSSWRVSGQPVGGKVTAFDGDVNRENAGTGVSIRDLPNALRREALGPAS